MQVVGGILPFCLEFLRADSGKTMKAFEQSRDPKIVRTSSTTRVSGVVEIRHWMLATDKQERLMFFCLLSWLT